MSMQSMSDDTYIRSGLYGLLIGDALGVPYEFHDASEIPPNEQIKFQPPTGFRRSHKGVAPGTWSDDGSQALCLFESLIEHPELDLVDFSNRLVRWRDEAHLQAGGRVFDVGTQTSRALKRIKNGHPPQLAGGRTEQENGNGSLMRVLPVALLHNPARESDFALIDKAMRQSLPTHAHPRSQLCCAQLVLWADGLRQKLNEDDAWNRAAEILTRFAAGADGAHTYRSFAADLAEECQRILVPVPGYVPSGSGYVLDSLWSARWAMRNRPYKAVVRAAVQLGNDTDTTAAIAGGLAGIRDGYVAIPKRWVALLHGRSLVDPLIARAVRIAAANNEERPASLRDSHYKHKAGESKMIKRKAVKLLINYDDDKNHGVVLSKLIDGAEKLDFLVAFAKSSGLGTILLSLQRGLASGLKARVAVGLDFYLTEPQLLRKLLKIAGQFEDNFRLYVSNSDYTFHPKIYAISGESGSTVLIGSANLTGGGMLYNHEASAQIDDPTNKLSRAVAKQMDELVEDEEIVQLTRARLGEYERVYNIHRMQQKLAKRRFDRLKEAPRAILETLQDFLAEMKRDKSHLGFDVQKIQRNENRKAAAVELDALAAVDDIKPAPFLEHYERLIKHFHSSGLNRGKTTIKKKPRRFQRSVREILASNAESPEQAYQILLNRFQEIPRAGINVLTEILHAINHDKFVVMNQNAVSGLRLAGFTAYPKNPLKTNVTAAMYAAFCRDAAKVRDELGLADFTELDALFDYAYW